MNNEFSPEVQVSQLPYSGGQLTCYNSDPAGRHATTIVLLHGSGGTAAGSFWALLPILALRNRVVTFDFRDSDDEANNYLEQAAAVITALGRGGPVHLVGYSFGAVIAAQLAAARPEVLQSLVLVAGWAKTDVQQLLRNDIWQALHDDRNPLLGQFAVFTTYSASYLSMRTPAELTKLIELNRNGDGRAAKMRFNRSVDVLNILDRITTPTLVVGCEMDQTAPIRHAQMLFGGIENARFFAMRTGHGVVHERPSELAAAIGDFVTDSERHPAGTIILNEHA